jgi:FlaA1/EpsC-like NDP-sugar epimerase
MEIEKYVSITKITTILLAVMYLWMEFVIKSVYSIAIAALTSVSALMFLFYLRVLKREIAKKEEEKEENEKGHARMRKY